METRYKKLNKIGSGTFGEAWLVSSVLSGRSYVIKEVRVNDLTEEDLANTQREAAVLARCKHINIIRYKENFLRADPLTMCLVMEYADGGDLFDKEKKAKIAGMLIPEQSIMHWFIQVVFAVHYLHTNNILHRDLKTQNIFLTRSGIVKVGDFGIARFLRTKQELATTAIGTPYYLSPEICQRKPYNHRSDMWALGCILYELCALKYPFEADDFQRLVMKILLGTFEPVSRMYSELVHDLIAVLLRTNPESRPTADQLLMIPQLRHLVEDYIQRQYFYINTNRTRAYSTDSIEQVTPEETVNSSSSSSGISSGASSSGSEQLDKYMRSLKSSAPLQELDQAQQDVCSVDAMSPRVKMMDASNQTPSPSNEPRQRKRRDSETQTPTNWSQARKNSQQKKPNESPSELPRKLYPYNLSTEGSHSANTVPQRTRAEASIYSGDFGGVSITPVARPTHEKKRKSIDGFSSPTKRASYSTTGSKGSGRNEMSHNEFVKEWIVDQSKVKESNYESKIKPELGRTYTLSFK